MAKALEFILLEKNQDEVGYFGKDGGRMYGHGIVTLPWQRCWAWEWMKRPINQLETNVRKRST